MKPGVLFTVMLVMVSCFVSITVQADVVTYPANDMIKVKSDSFDYHTCIDVKSGQEYIIIYLTGNDEWYVAHNVYDGKNVMQINGAWDWASGSMPTPQEAMKAVRVDKRRVIASHPVDDCIKNKEITKWVITLKHINK